jgi:Fur family peroxide stress response transcriptional regulator
MERTIKNSKKRNAIYDAVLGTKDHPSAEWVYAQLKPAFPDLSLGTVYRNLNFFKEQGTIISLGVIGGQERFDANIRPHAHFICSCCGRVIDVETAGLQIQGLYPPVEQAISAQVDSHQLVFTGKCSLCKSKDER